MKFNTLRINEIASELNIKLGDIENGTKFRKASRMNFVNEDELRNWLVENCKACQFDKFAYVLACGRKWKNRLMTLQEDGYDGDVMMYTATYEAGESNKAEAERCRRNMKRCLAWLNASENRRAASDTRL